MGLWKWLVGERKGDQVHIFKITITKLTAINQQDKYKSIEIKATSGLSAINIAKVRYPDWYIVNIEKGM